MNKRILNVLVLVCFWVGDCFGVQLRFRHYTSEDGLSNNSIQCMVQDRYGYLWFGTGDGLNRFDSKEFKTFRHDIGDSTTIGNNNVHSIHEDSEGNIWVGTENGVYVYDPIIEKFREFRLPQSNLNHLKNIVYSIKEDKDKNIWISVFGNGLFCYNLTKRSIKHYSKTDENNSSINTNLTTKLLVDNDGDVWVGSHGNGISRYDRERDVFVPVDIEDPVTGKKVNYTYALCDDTFGNLWFCDNGLFRYNKSKKTCSLYLSNTTNGLRNIHYIMENSPGNLLIGSDDGLTFFNTIENTHQTFRYDILFPQGLNDLFVYSILKDKEGGIWVGTYSGGLNYLSPGNTWFELHTYSLEEDGLHGKIVNTFCESADGSIWVGTDDKGLFKFEPRKKVFKPVVIDNEMNISVHSLLCDNNILWIGTYAKGLYSYNLITGKIFQYTGDNKKGLDSRSIYSLYKDNSGTLWLGTQESVYVYDKENDSFSCILDLGYNCYVSDILEDAHHNIWFASQGKGLISYNKKTNTTVFYSEVSDLPEMVSCLNLENNKLRIGTGGYGLYTMDITSGKIEKEDNQIFKRHNNIQCIIPGYNELWLTTNLGLLRYSLHDESISYYNFEEGLQSPPFNSNAGLKSGSGSIYIGGSNGFNIFNPENIKKNDVLPNVVFTNLQLYNRDLPIGDNSVLNSRIDDQRCVRLPYNYSVFTIEFVTTSYCAPSKNTYKYKLKGFDSDWVYTDNRDNKATYTNLSPGEYVFKVLSSNNDGFWSEEEAEIQITILPPWWQTRIMLVLYIMLLFLAIILGYFFLAKRLTKRHKGRIEVLKHENERKLFEAKLNLFTNITHEIRTPVSLILAPVEQILNHKDLPEDVITDLDVVKKNSERLLDLSNQILDFTKAEQDTFTVKNTTFDVTELVKKITKRFKPTAQQKGITMNNVLPESLPVFVNTDRESLTKIISNLLTNALKFTKSRINITVEKDDAIKCTVIKVEDDGKGINKAEQDKIFDLFYQSENNSHLPVKGFGIGLATVSLLAKRMGLTIKIESEENEFTRFIIYIPQKDYDSIITDGINGTDVIEEERKYFTDEIKENKAEPVERELNTEKDGIVLIAEDNVEFTAYLKRVISQKYTVFTAENGKEAVAILENVSPDIIISDVMMPEMDGMEFCKYIKTNIKFSHIPFILLTAKIDTSSKIEGLECGADVYIEKPVSINYLYAQMISLLDNRNKLKHLFSERPFTPISSITENPKDVQWLEELNNCIQENISNTNLQVDDISKEICVSRTSLYSKIKAMTGLTPNDYIRLIRLKKAAELLKNSDLKINEISYMVGFSTASYFSKCFKNQFGILPVEFMEQEKKGNSNRTNTNINS